MQNVGRGHTPSQLPIDRNVIAVDEVADPHFARDCLSRFVDASIGGHVRVTVDDAGRDVLAMKVDDCGVVRDQ